MADLTKVITNRLIKEKDYQLSYLTFTLGYDIKPHEYPTFPRDIKWNNKDCILFFNRERDYIAIEDQGEALNFFNTVWLELEVFKS
jgi:hypothetical protein